MAVDQTTYLESLLMRQDKMSMAESVEARVPFVHLPLAKVLNAIPQSIRLPGGETKPMLKAMMAPMLPHDLLHRRKVGLLLPHLEWLQDDHSLGRFLPDLTAPDGQFRQFAGKAAIDRVVEEFRRRPDQSNGNLVMSLVNIETWLRWLNQKPE